MSLATRPFEALRNLKVSTKLVLLLAFMAVPVVLLGRFVALDGLSKISVASAEQQGVDYLLALDPVVDAVARHRSLATLQQMRSEAEDLGLYE